MKKLFILPLLFLAGFIHAQGLEGAWKMTHQDGKEVNDREIIKLFQDGYFAFGAKELGSNKFLGAGGGPFSLENNVYTETLDFYTMMPEKVGSIRTFNLDKTGDKIVISGDADGKTRVEIWERIGDRTDDLTRNWVFTGRKSNGEISRSTPGARRTVKILSGGRFQWIAFNSETREFMGTGGGTYTAENGKYTENITFFSRDESRVGASLSFDFEIKNGEWHHSGLSSAGNPIYEIWSKYADAYKPNK